MNLKSKFNWIGAILFAAGLTIGSAAWSQTNVARTGIFYRGTGTNATYHSMVIPLDFEKGVALDNLNGNATNLFPGLTNFYAGHILYHYDATNAASSNNIALRIPYNNPIVAFGSRVGGSPLYFDQDYHFGVYAGETGPYSAYSSIYVKVYRRSDFQYVGQFSNTIPEMDVTNTWQPFLTNGYQQSTTAYGLTTTVRFDDPLVMWGVDTPGCYHLTQRATQTATNYIYEVIVLGYAPGIFLSTLDNGQGVWSLLYTLEFEPRPPWRAVILDQPQFTGTPAPSSYQGKSLTELLTNAPPVTNTVSLSPSACTNLDDSPELRRHPTLDQFVADMGNDPLALANFVQNEIELTDAIAYNDNGSVSDISINLGGVNRSALGTFMERQGSPTEQCALLVYLLREAGVPAAYVFPPQNGVKMLDTQLSKLLRMQIHGAINFTVGNNNQPYTTNVLIPVNYPWVAAYIGTNWVHLFPWLKDTEVTEGLNLFDYMPTNYSTGYQWVRDYLYGNTNIMGLSTEDDTPQTLFPLFVKNALAANAPGISLDDLGVQIINRRHYYSRWTDFPRPPFVTNVSTDVESLSSPALTNVYAGLTNIFDTVSVTVSSVTNPAVKISTGDLRMADLDNRKFLIRTEKISSTQHRLIMSLEPYRSDATGTGQFTNDTTLLNQQSATNVLGTSDDALNVQITYNRHRFLPPDFVKPDFTIPYLGLDEETTIQQTRPMRKGDLAAICLDVGRVTPQMLQVHAQELWNMENTLKSDPSATNTLSPDVYQGTVAYLMGMAYYEKVGQFDAFLQHLTKVQAVSEAAMGLASIRAARTNGVLPSGNIDLVQPSVDMFFQEVTYAGNGTLHLDSGDDGNVPNDDYFHLLSADYSAEEHAIINHYFQQTDAVSTVKLLQMAQAASATNGQPGIVFLDRNNYTAVGNSNYPTTGSVKLKDQDPTLWADITNAFLSYPYPYANYAQVFITPGPVTNHTGSFKGMGAFIVQPGDVTAYIAPKLNGGYGAENPSGSLDLGNTPNLSLNLDPNGDYYIDLASTGSGNITLAPDSFASYDAGSVVGNANSDYYTYSPFQDTWTASSQDYLGLNSQGSLNLDFSQSVQASSGDSGLLSWLGDALGTAWSHVSDPVHSVTGEFYVNATDLSLPGPMPLNISRNYSSLNLADNQFGYGWKLNYMPYLSANASNTVLYAAEADGSVLAYRQTTTNANVYLPDPSLNPQLNNDRTAGIGSVANRLRNRIVKQVDGSDTFYTLYGSDGSTRLFQEMTFTGTVNRTRPYLMTWQDSRGNNFTFQYGTNSMDPDYGELRRVQSSNGNFLGFYYDVYGHITEAYTGDGRRVEYDYDQYGDLASVTLPDQSVIGYQYAHDSQSVTNGSTVTQEFYSTHLITEEDKPDGRELVNTYDDQRRVTNQLSTAGVDLIPIRTATFVYANNFNLTNSFTNGITGYTLLIDGNGNTNRYDYTNSLITKITDPLGQTIQQNWYADNATAPGYPRSLYQVKDKRGLWTQYQYDASGNLTNTMQWGDLTGDGTTQYATNTATFNTNDLPLKLTDPAGNSVVTVYDPTYNFLPQQTIRYAGATPVNTNFMVYGNATNVVVNGSVTQTNIAYGVMTRRIRAYASSDAATNDFAYDGHGFLTQAVLYTGTSDPNVTNTLFYNERGELVEQMDALGRKNNFDYDPLDRPLSHEVFDANQAEPISWDFSYYNENGELVWSDGPRYNPEDYVWRDYDGAGRVDTEIHWRSEAKSDGTGVEAPSGYNLYAQTFYQYDPLGNLTLKVDPRGAMTTNRYDALARLVQTKHLDLDGVTILSSEGFSYEPGGEVQTHTNALGGVTTTLYADTGKPEYRSNPDGSTNAWRYYLDGRLKRKIQRNGAYWQTTYDDANRITTRIFYSAAGVPLATNSTQLDRRGNVFVRVDAGGNAFTNIYDGLDRLKVSKGPAIVTVSATGMDPENPTYVTNVLTHATTNYYGLAGSVTTNVNTLGEKTITFFDALGRVTATDIYSSSGTLVRETSMAYSSDHDSVTTTNGSGASAIVSTVYTDNDGRNLLAIHYPNANAREFTLNQYDLAGNLTSTEHNSSTNGTVTLWTSVTNTYDGLNRLTSKHDRDNAATTYAYDAMGDLSNRTMPGDLQWDATYNNAGQMTKEWNVGSDSSGTRTNTYTYYSSGSAFAGLPYTRTDARGLVSTNTYDDWLRRSSVSREDPVYSYFNTSWTYDPRGYLTDVTEQHQDLDDVPLINEVSRTYDAYGQLSSEYVSVFGATYSSAYLSWDAAGRRTGLDFTYFTYPLAFFTYQFSWQADGSLAAVTTPAGNAAYSYDTAGILTNRTVGNRLTTVSSRDGMGRPLSVTTKVNLLTKLTETLNWTGDGLLSTHTLARADFTDSRSYSYADLSRRLTEEQLDLDGSTRWTNAFTYDNGTTAGLGVLTRAGAPSTSSAVWNGSTSTFGRVNSETNTMSTYPAYGRVNGESTVTALLDGEPLPVTLNNSGDSTYPYQWRTTMELSPGAHQLAVAATHPSGLFTTNASITFTNDLAQQAASVLRDQDGNITNRVWRDPDGGTNLTQDLVWDARDRLSRVTEQDSHGNGYVWVANYDGLNRRLISQYFSMTNGVVSLAYPLIGYTLIDQFYDPLVEFLELGTHTIGETQWKLYGPDLNGHYGGMNGMGGLEAVASDYGQFRPVIADARGNILGAVTNGAVAWNPSRSTGYGAVPGRRPVALWHGADTAEASAWRGHWPDIMGTYHLGMRDYDPVAGMWLSYDPTWNEQDPNYLSFSGDDPVNSFDSDGRVSRALYQTAGSYAQGIEGLVNNAYYSASYGASALVYGSDQANQWYGQNLQGLKNTVTGTAQTTYDAAAFASFELLNGIAPEQTAQAYGPSIERLYNLDVAFTGGENNSGYYRTGATIANAGLFVLGGEVGNIGRVGEISGASVSSAEGEIMLVNGRLPINSKYAGGTYPPENLSPELQTLYPNSVTFTPQGFPAFSPYAQAEVKIEGLTGNYSIDAAMANKAVGLTETPEGYVWHHVEDATTMQLVPQDIHQAVRHTGGAAIITGGN